jgi:hypothetical protein
MMAYPFGLSPILQGMLVAIVSLAAVSVAGLVYPWVRGRAGLEDEEAGGLSGEEYRYHYGSKETLERLRKMREEGQFPEGVILAYRALRNLLPKADVFSQNKGNTEFEIISETIKASPELRDGAQPIMQAYEYYERARFAKQVSSDEFEKAIATFDKIYSSPAVRRKPRGN